MDDSFTFPIGMTGTARALVVSSTFGLFTPAEFIDLSPTETDPALMNEVKRARVCPIYCVHVSLPGMSLLIDASADVISPGAHDAPPGVSQPPGLISRLREHAIMPEGVTHVVITHGHGDHVSGLTIDQGGRCVPQFPNARHYFGEPEWNSPRFQEVLSDPTHLISRTLGTVAKAGKLTLVAGDLDLGAGVSILAAPGETPGHQVVRITSGGETLFCLGDLYHFEFEFEHPHVFAKWKAPEQITASRAAIVKRIFADNATLVVTHIPGRGRLVLENSTTCWQAA